MLKAPGMQALANEASRILKRPLWPVMRSRCKKLPVNGKIPLTGRLFDGPQETDIGSVKNV